MGLEMPNELHNRGALIDAHAHAALIILMVVKRDQYSLLSRQLKRCSATTAHRIVQVS